MLRFAAAGVQRPLSAVPWPVAGFAGAALLLHVLLRALQPAPGASVAPLPPAPSARLMHVAAAGEPVTLARLLGLWLQAQDNQPGVNIPYARLDYPRLRDWLDRILDLDPHSSAPLLAATRLYGAIREPAKQRIMLTWVQRRFAQDPARRWRWLAHAALVAKYQMDDTELALQLARGLTDAPREAGIPFWARDLSVLILEDRCELQAASVLIGGLLAEGHMHDPAERRFLERRLQVMDRESCEPISGRERLRALSRP